MDSCADDIIRLIIFNCDLDSLVNLRSTCKEFIITINNNVTTLCKINNLYSTNNFYFYALMYSKIHQTKYSYLFNQTKLIKNYLANKSDLFNVLKTNNLDLVKQAWEECVQKSEKRYGRVHRRYNRKDTISYKLTHCSKEIVDYIVGELAKDKNQLPYYLCEAICTGNEYLIKSVWKDDMNLDDNIKDNLLDAAIQSKNIRLMESIDTNFPLFKLVDEISIALLTAILTNLISFSSIAELSKSFTSNSFNCFIISFLLN